MMRLRTVSRLGLLTAAVVAGFVTSLALGSSLIPPGRVLAALFGEGARMRKASEPKIIAVVANEASTLGKT